jgi:hypothetical protein
MRAVPDFPSEVAVMVAEPDVIPVISPVAETVADDGLELDQLTLKPVSTLLFASLMVADSCRACPLVSIAD